MAIDKRVASLSDAVAGIRDGMTVFISGFGGAGFPNHLLGALLDLAPRELTLVAHSAVHRFSRTHELIEAGLVHKVICTSARRPDGARTKLDEMIGAGKVAIEMVPQGTFVERIRAGGAGIPAFYTAVTVGTPLARGKEVRRFNGIDYVLEEAIKGDVALVGADTADRFGNLALRYTQMNFGPAMATAAALTIAEVRRFSDAPLPPERIVVPGVYVGRAVAVGAAS